MDSASISDLAALAGAAIGGLTSFATSWLAQQTQIKAQQVAHKLTRREELYKDFIEEASKLYADSLIQGAIVASRRRFYRTGILVSSLLAGCTSWHRPMPIPPELTEAGVQARLRIPADPNANRAETMVRVSHGLLSGAHASWHDTVQLAYLTMHSPSSTMLNR